VIKINKITAGTVNNGSSLSLPKYVIRETYKPILCVFMVSGINSLEIYKVEPRILVLKSLKI